MGTGWVGVGGTRDNKPQSWVDLHASAELRPYVLSLGALLLSIWRLTLRILIVAPLWWSSYLFSLHLSILCGASVFSAGDDPILGCCGDERVALPACVVRGWVLMKRAMIGKCLAGVSVPHTWAMLPFCDGIWTSCPTPASSPGLRENLVYTPCSKALHVIFSHNEILTSGSPDFFFMIWYLLCHLL